MSARRRRMLRGALDTFGHFAGLPPRPDPDEVISDLPADPGTYVFLNAALDRSAGLSYAVITPNETEPAMYKTVAEHAKEIRTALKAAGVPARAVSVRSDSYSMGSSITVEIKTFVGVDFAVVKAAAEGHESVSRDHNGEILGGGNRYVDVRISSEAVAEAVATVTIRENGSFDFLGRTALVLTTDGKPDGFYVKGIVQHTRWQFADVAGTVAEMFKAGRPAVALVAGPVDVAALESMFA